MTATAVDRRLLLAVAGADGVLEVVDFLLPLWAGAALGASAAVAGALLATQAAASLIARPWAARVVDRAARGAVAGGAALLMALAMVGYAVAASTVVAVAAAAATGVGMAFFHTAVLAHVADLDPSPRGYGRLLSFESRGALIAFTVVFLVLDQVDYVVLFLGFAAVFAIAFTLIRIARLPAGAEGSATARPPARLTRTLLPVAGLVLVTTAARALLLLLVLLRLQRHFGLSVRDVGLVMAPGFLVFVAASTLAHRLTARLGRRWTLVVMLLLTGLTAAVLPAADSVVGLALGWTAAAAGFAVSIPVERSLIATMSGARAGHGFGIQGAAAVGGAVVGSSVAGVLYGATGWAVACAVTVVVVLVALAIVPTATASPEAA